MNYLNKFQNQEKSYFFRIDSDFYLNMLNSFTIFSV